VLNGISSIYRKDASDFTVHIALYHPVQARILPEQLAAYAVNILPAAGIICCKLYLYSVPDGGGTVV